ncbi:MAG TPA: DUF6531 domain-containing protein, partial [Candidatus Hydrogenedentes bacterium]|nr:DUF6531 domain-containing protein [Candidatus Hydrogenedentota bacterium]
MKKNTTRFLMALACALLFLPAAARADDYNYVVSFYLYLDGVLQNLSSLPTDDSVIEVDVLGSGQIHYHSYNITIGMFCAGICVGPEVGFFLHDADFFAPGATVDKWLRNGAIYEGSGLFYSSDDDFDWSVSLYLKSAGTQVRNPVSPRWDPDAGRRSGGGLLWGPAYQAASRTVDNPKSSAYPALLYSGEAFEKQVDFAVPGRGLDFVWSRIHRSSASADPYFGGEWSHNFDISAISLHLGSDFVYDVHMGNGITTRFRYHGYHAVKTPFCYYADGWDAALTEDDESGDVAILFGDGVVWSFVYSDVTDRNIIDEIADRFGNTLSFAYDAQDRLQTITDTLGRTYTISYNPDGTIASLTENAGLGRSIAYAYNGGNLETVTYPGGDTIGYTYDGENRLQTVTDGRGNVSLTNTYTDGFLTSQQHGSGPEAGTVAFTYTGLTLESGEARGTRTTDGAGHVTEHFFNSRNQLVRRCEIGPDETYTTRIAWESHIFNSKLISDDVPTQITLPDGVIISYQYAGLGTTAPAYTRRLNLTRIERLANDGSGTKLVTLFDHDDSLPVWDARFGETFVTRRTVRDKGGVLLERATYTYSTDGLATLDGIDYDGLPLYTAPHHHQEFAYNAQGQVTQHIHPKNPVAGNEDHRRRDTFAYTNGYLTAQVADADGLALKTSFEPDNVGRVQKTAAPNGHSGGVPIEARKSIFHWNHLDRLEEVEYPQTSATITQRPTSSFEHDANGNVTCIQRAWFDEGGSSVLFGNPIFDPEDGGDALVATRFDYDTRNRVTQVRRETDSVKNVTAYHYDANGNIVELETPLAAAGTEPDNVVEYEYDARDLPVRIVRSGQVVTRLDYDAAGRVTRRIEGYGTPEARGWEYTYDSLGQLASGVDPVGLETQYVRDALGRATRVDAVGPDSALLARTDYGYDLAGRLTDVNAMHKDADGINIADGWSHVDLVFSDAGRLVSRVLEGTATQYAYDTVSRVASVTAASGDALEYAYDADGNVTSVTETALDTASKADAEFETEYEYDYLGRLVETRILGGATPNTAGYGYDSFGRPVVETDGRSNVTEYAYDPLGQLTEAAHDATGIDAAQLYGYDANGRLTIEIDPNSNETVHEYDILGRPVRTTYADGTAEEFRQYDAVGNPREHVAPNGLITHAAYDALGRPVAQHFDHLAGRSDPGTTTYAYDPLGRLVAAANDASVVTQRYDTLGNVVEE